MNQLWANEEFTNGRTLLAAERPSKGPLLLGLISSTGIRPWESVGMGGQWVASCQTQMAGPLPRSDSEGSERVCQLWFIS